MCMNQNKKKKNSAVKTVESKSFFFYKVRLSHTYTKIKALTKVSHFLSKRTLLHTKHPMMCTEWSSKYNRLLLKFGLPVRKEKQKYYTN